MRKHTDIYLKGMGYHPSEFIPSEISDLPAVDTHHIIGRGKGGEDRLENLMAVTRDEHLKFGDKKEHMVYLLTRHREYLALRNIKFDMNWFDEKIKHYKSVGV